MRTLHPHEVDAVAGCYSLTRVLFVPANLPANNTLHRRKLLYYTRNLIAIIIASFTHFQAEARGYQDWGGIDE